MEPFAGLVFGYTPGESTKLSSVQNAGVLVGMVLVALAGSGIRSKSLGSMKAWTIAGCGASALALVGIAMASLVGPAWPLRASVFALGVTNGAYAIAAIGSMMAIDVYKRQTPSRSSRPLISVVSSRWRKPSAVAPSRLHDGRRS